MPSAAYPLADTIDDLMTKLHNLNSACCSEKGGRSESVRLMAQLLDCDYHYLGDLDDEVVARPVGVGFEALDCGVVLWLRQVVLLADTRQGPLGI